MIHQNYKKSKRGFSLIELIIVIAIIGIIAAVAIPSYNSYLTKTRRADATIFLTEVAGEQFRFFSENNRYATNMAELGYGNDDFELSTEGYYLVGVQSPTPTSYTLTATPAVGGPQVSDAECLSFTFNSSKQKGITGSGLLEDCW